MISSALKKFAQEKGMTMDHGAAYGEVDGYTVTLRDGLDVTTASFAVSFADDAEREQVIRTLTDAQRVRQYRLAAPIVTPETITVNFIEGSGMLDKIRSFLLWFPAVLSENHAIGANSCACCHKPVSEEEPSSFVMADGIAMHLHPDCAAALSAASPKEAPSKKKIGRGLLGAVLGTIIGMIPWIIITALNWPLVGWLGFVIAFLAKKGYEILGGKPSKAKFPIILISSIVGIFLAQLIGQCIFFYNALLELGMTLDILSLPSMVFGTYQYGWFFLMEGGEYLESAWFNLGLPLLNVIVAIGLSALWISSTPKEARVAAEKESLKGVILLSGEPIPEVLKDQELLEPDDDTDVSSEAEPLEETEEMEEIPSED